MRKLLIAVLLGIVVGGLSSLPVERAQASHYSVTVSLYHPTGDSTNSARLTCGWHTTCDGVFTDAQTGLDWVWPNQISYEVRLRLFINASLTTQTQVGSVRTYNATSGCYQVRADVRRTNGTRVGFVINQHVSTTTPITYNIFGRDQGIRSDRSIGTMVVTDNCTTFGRHDMQWYQRVDASTSIAKGSGYPTESGCWDANCYQAYGHFLTREYYFSYLHQ